MRASLATQRGDTTKPEHNLVFILKSALGTDILFEQWESLGFECRWVKAGPDFKSLKNALVKATSGVEGPWLAHPGWTDWGERPEWAQEVKALGGIPVAPAVKHLNLFSHLLNFLQEAEKSGIPNCLLFPYPLASVRELKKVVKEFPVVLKSVRSPRRGLGIRDVTSENDLRDEVPIWLSQIHELEGDSLFLVERFIEGARLVRFPFVRNQKGEVTFFETVDASLQYQYRPLVMMSPAPSLDPKVEKNIHQKSELFLGKLNYQGYGSFDFLVDGNRFFIVKGYTTLRLDSLAWEKPSGVKALAEQLQAYQISAAKQPRRPKDQSYCLMFLRAEDPILQIPSPGVFSERIVPEGIGFHLIPENETTYDSEGWLGLWTGKTQEALSSIKKLWIHGTGLSNQKFLIDVMSHPWVQNGSFYLGFLQEEFVPDFRPPLSVLQFAVNVCAAHSKETLQTDWRILQYKIRSQMIPKTPKRGVWNDETTEEKLPYSIVESTYGHWSARIGTWCFHVKRIDPQEKGVWIKSLIHGVVRKINATTPYVWVESYDRWIAHSGPQSVKSLKWKVKLGDEVALGQPLVELKK